MELPAAFRAIGEALLIGLLVGVEREASSEERHAGVRDFLIIALSGGLCGLLGNSWLTGAALISIAGLLGVFHLQVKDRTGITTEMAAVATFALGYLTASPSVPQGAPLAIGVTIVVVAFLEAKRSLHKFVRETINEREFNNTLQFLAMIFVVYPVLPQGQFGPYQFFAPRQVWLFVILVSSISYLGYFLEKFLGERKGMDFASILGGLASTTAATTAFARGCAEEPRKLVLYWQATVLANSILFPRIVAILYVVNPTLARALLVPAAAMMAAGLLLAFFIRRTTGETQPLGEMPIRNPFRILPALQFGAIFAAILFFSKAATMELGGGAVYWTSALGGSLDVDSVSVSVADLLHGGHISLASASGAVLLAVATNAVLKTLIAFLSGGFSFGWRVAVGFAVMFAPGAVVLGWGAGRS